MSVNPASSAPTKHTALLPGYSSLAVSLTVLAFLLALLLRLDSFRDDLWVDELHSAWVVDGPWNELVSRAAIGNQSPLYFAIVKLITLVFGLSEWSLRGPSLVAGMGLVIAAWQFTRRVTKDAWCALLAVLCVAIDSSCVFYSSEARPYALMQLALACLLILVVEGSASRRIAVFRALLAAFAIHLQFTSLIFLAPFYAARIAVTWFEGKKDGKRLWAMLALEMGIVVFLCAPLAPQAFEIAGRGKAWASFIPYPSLVGFAKMFPWVPAMISLIGFAIVRLTSKKTNVAAPSPPQASSALGWFVCSSFAPIGLALVVSILGIAPIFYGRYLLAAFWPLLMIAGLCLSQWRRLTKVALAGIIVIAMIWESDLIAPDRWNAGRITKSRNESWSTATRRIAELDPRGELPLFVVAGLIESRNLKDNPSPVLREYCKLPIATLYRVPHRFDEVEPVSSVVPYEPPGIWVDRVLEKGGGIWILRVREPDDRPWRRFGERFIERLNRRSKEKSWQLTLDNDPGVAVLQIRRMSNKLP